MMNDRNTRQILSFRDYCFVLEQRKRELQDRDTRAGKEENKRQVNGVSVKSVSSGLRTG